MNKHFILYAPPCGTMVCIKHNDDTVYSGSTDGVSALYATLDYLGITREIVELPWDIFVEKYIE
jgi:hypothetical protein